MTWKPRRPAYGQVCVLSDCPTWDAESTVTKQRIAVHRQRTEGEPYGWFTHNGKPIFDPNTLVRPVQEQ